MRPVDRWRRCVVWEGEAGFYRLRRRAKKMRPLKNMWAGFYVDKKLEENHAHWKHSRSFNELTAEPWGRARAR